MQKFLQFVSYLSTVYLKLLWLLALYKYPCSADKPKLGISPNHSFNCCWPFPATIKTLFFLSLVNSVNKLLISSLGFLSLNNFSTFSWPIFSVGRVPSKSRNINLLKDWPYIWVITSGSSCSNFVDIFLSLKLKVSSTPR